MRKPGRTLKAALIITAAALAYAVYAALMIRLFGTSCPLKAFFGVPCPGCGMTRALFRALRGDFAAAFELHPLFWLAPGLAVCVVWYAVKPNKKCAVLLAVICAVFLAVYAVRLLLGWRG